MFANVALLVAVAGFVLRSPNNASSVAGSEVVSAGSTAVATNALDQVSSADIAVHVARLARLEEATSVANNADSINAQLAVTPAADSVVAKPQIVATTLKSKRDIQTYVTKDGDNVPNIAAKFNVTSDTIRWSNGLTGDRVAAGTTLAISPVNGIVYTVKQGDTPDSLATKFRANKDQVIAFNDAEVSGLKIGEKIVIPDGSQPPVGRVASLSSGSGFAWGATAIYGANGYDYGWCTWYAAGRRAELGRPVPSNLGNAYSWYVIAQRAGLPTGLTPKAGAVAVNEGGNHVSVVEVVNDDGSFWISEMNSRGQVSMTDSTPTGGWGRKDWKLIGGAGSLKFIY